MKPSIAAPATSRRTASLVFTIYYSLLLPTRFGDGAGCRSVLDRFYGANATRFQAAAYAPVRDTSLAVGAHAIHLIVDRDTLGIAKTKTTPVHRQEVMVTPAPVYVEGVIAQWREVANPPDTETARLCRRWCVGIDLHFFGFAGGSVRPRLGPRLILSPGLHCEHRDRRKDKDAVDFIHIPTPLGHQQLTSL